MKNSARFLMGTIILMGTWSAQTTLAQATSQSQTTVTTQNRSLSGMDTYVVFNTQLVPIESPAGQQQVQRALLLTSPEYRSENAANFRMYVVPKGTYPTNYTIDQQGRVHWNSPKQTAQSRRRRSRRVYSRALAAIPRQSVPMTNVALSGGQAVQTSAVNSVPMRMAANETNASAPVATATSDGLARYSTTSPNQRASTGFSQSTTTAPAVPANSSSAADTTATGMTASTPSTASADVTFATKPARTPVTPTPVSPSTGTKAARLPQTDEQATLLMKLLGGGLLGSLGLLGAWYGYRRR